MCIHIYITRSNTKNRISTNPPTKPNHPPHQTKPTPPPNQTIKIIGSCCRGSNDATDLIITMITTVKSNINITAFKCKTKYSFFQIYPPWKFKQQTKILPHQKQSKVCPLVQQQGNKKQNHQKNQSNVHLIWTFCSENHQKNKSKSPKE